jgi:HlyD family secretion protein
MKSCLPVSLGLLALAGLTLAGCARRGPSTYQGYLEGEFVHVASPLAGRLEQLTVHKGARITAGTPLFVLEQGSELAALREAAERARQAQARLADLRKGQRPTELASLAARLEESQATAAQAVRDLERAKQLYASSFYTEIDLDRARLAVESTAQQVADLTSQLETAKLGARSDQIAAAEADAAAAQAALDRAGWSVTQKNVAAPRDGLVYDVLYWPGEFVTASAPVVVLLPPENIKVRFFVPEAEFGALKAGAPVQVAITGRDQPLEARISFLSPQPEYTPPVLYNRENRSKLVFMVEATFAADDARDLHPGQPVDVLR